MAAPGGNGDAADARVRRRDGVLALLPADPEEPGGRCGAGGVRGGNGFLGGRRSGGDGLGPLTGSEDAVHMGSRRSAENNG